MQQLIFCLRDLGVNLAYWQFSSHLLTYNGSTRLGDIKLEGGFARYGLHVRQPHRLSQFEGVGTDGTFYVFGVLIQGELEIDVTRLRCQQSSKLLTFPQHIERASITNGSQVMKLFHQESLHRELADDALLGTTMGRHAVYIEVHLHVVFVLQVLDESRCADVQVFLHSTHLDIPEHHTLIVTTHACLQQQGLLEVLQ